MVLAGDEFGQTQHGNNNAYCQDSPLAWLDWRLSAEQRELAGFVREVMRLRKTQPVFRRRRFFQGRPIRGADVKDIYWLKADGTEMTEADWNAGHALCIGMVLPGDQIMELNERAERIEGDTFAILFNAHHERLAFRLGTRRRDVRWTCVLETTASAALARTFDHMSEFPLGGRSVAVLRASIIETSSANP
jgi:glycogen operon protein